VSEKKNGGEEVWGRKKFHLKSCRGVLGKSCVGRKKKRGGVGGYSRGGGLVSKFEKVKRSHRENRGEPKGDPASKMGRKGELTRRQTEHCSNR